MPAQQILLFVSMLCAAGDAALGQTPAPLTPFIARYNVEWRGVSVGSSTVELAAVADGQYRYRSVNHARGLFRLAFPDAIREESLLQVIGGDQVRPLRFRGDDGGSEGADGDIDLQFDWQRNRVTGRFESTPIDLNVPAGTQDALSAQLALMLDLAAGRTPSGYWLVDKGQLKDYEYRREPDATLDTVLGPLPTVVWTSRRPSSERVTRIWYAPAFGYVPVKAERWRKNRLEFALRLARLERPTGTPVTYARGNVTPR
ncbi:MAG: DUF3108 domain-containing protein [Gammaproteobacteria bacterium]|nr:DUF3108 domain-containing protein [Gammaproteobacteria bacterium]